MGLVVGGSCNAIVRSATVERMIVVTSEEESVGPGNSEDHSDVYKVSNIQRDPVPPVGNKAGKAVHGALGILSSEVTSGVKS